VIGSIACDFLRYWRVVLRLLILTVDQSDRSECEDEGAQAGMVRSHSVDSMASACSDGGSSHTCIDDASQHNV
jgi:hypothetical protein